MRNIIKINLNKMIEDKKMAIIKKFNNSIILYDMNNSMICLVKESKITYNSFIMEKGLELVSDFINGSAIVKRDNHYGLISTTGTILTPIIYDNIREQKNGCYIIKENGLYGALDSNGNKISTCQYDYFSDFENNFSVVGKNELYRYINKSGKTTKDFYKSCSKFNNGIGRAEDIDGNIFYINENFEKIHLNFKRDRENIYQTISNNDYATLNSINKNTSNDFITPNEKGISFETGNIIYDFGKTIIPISQISGYLVSVIINGEYIYTNCEEYKYRKSKLKRNPDVIIYHNKKRVYVGFCEKIIDISEDIALIYMYNTQEYKYIYLKNKEMNLLYESPLFEKAFNYVNKRAFVKRKNCETFEIRDENGELVTITNYIYIQQKDNYFIAIDKQNNKKIIDSNNNIIDVMSKTKEKENDTQTINVNINDYQLYKKLQSSPYSKYISEINMEFSEYELIEKELIEIINSVGLLKLKELINQKHEEFNINYKEAIERELTTKKREMQLNKLIINLDLEPTKSSEDILKEYINELKEYLGALESNKESIDLITLIDESILLFQGENTKIRNDILSDLNILINLFNNLEPELKERQIEEIVRSLQEGKELVKKQLVQKVMGNNDKEDYPMTLSEWEILMRRSMYKYINEFKNLMKLQEINKGIKDKQVMINNLKNGEIKYISFIISIIADKISNIKSKLSLFYNNDTYKDTIEIYNKKIKELEVKLKVNYEETINNNATRFNKILSEVIKLELEINEFTTKLEKITIIKR